MKFFFTVFEKYTDKELNMFEKEFNDYEEAQIWADEHYNTDSYCTIDELD